MSENLIKFYKFYKPHHKVGDFIFWAIYLPTLKPFVYFYYTFIKPICPCRKLGPLKVPKFYTKESLARLQVFKAKDTDIMISSYPRSGTHWLAYIVALIVNKGQLPDGKCLYDVIKFLGMLGTFLDEKDMDSMPNPRIFIEHMPYHIYKPIGSPKTKFIYIARDPREVAVSFYKMLNSKHTFPHNLLIGYKGTWPEFFDAFMSGKAYYGSWFEHVNEWYMRRNDENVLFLWYEELLKDLSGSVKKIAEFLNYPITQDQVKHISAKTSFSVMKTDKDVKIADFFLLPPKTFFRSGTNQSWEKYFTEEQTTIMENQLKNYEYHEHFDSK